MKKALLGLTGALLATSAFTAANAAVISTNGTVAGVYTAATTPAIAAEAITAAAQTLGAAAPTNLTIALSSTIGGVAATTFAVRTNVTGANFNTPNTILADTIPAADGSCAQFTQSATSLTFVCTANAGKTVTGVSILPPGAAFVSTGAGAPGAITLDAKISPDTNFLSDVEAPAPATSVTNIVNAVSFTVTAGTTVTIQQAPTAPGTAEFGSFATNSLTANIATVGITVAAPAGGLFLRDGTTAVNAALINGYIGASASGNSVTVTAPIIADPAITTVTVAGASVNKTANPTAFSGSTVTIPLTAAQASLAGTTSNIVVTSNGNSAIPANVGGTATFDANTASAGVFADDAAVTGNTAAFIRGGFTADLNNFYTLTSAYESFIRIVNPTLSAGPATLTIWNADTGALVCTTTTPTVPANGTLEASRATIVALCGAQLPATLPTYLNARVNGAFNGYAQHVVWNNRTTVTDLSGRR